jgi:hypothetical protein
MDPQVRCTCGAESFKPVAPTQGDMEACEAEVVAAAEHVDMWLLIDGYITNHHPNAKRLALACQTLSFARAGVLTR